MENNSMKIEGIGLLMNELVGKPVLKVNAGGSTGSIFSLDFGNQLIKVEKGGHTFFEGEYVLMVYCAWRLDDLKLHEPMTGWHENSDLNGVMTFRLKTLLNDVVENVSLKSFFDCEIFFKSGKRLTVFCDLTPYVDADTNWFFRSGGKYYSVDNSLKCIAEQSSASL
jgi:hypothetical protein